jgi:hypothetical protein
MSRKLKYERPLSRNLSELVVKGGGMADDPLGECKSGYFPWNGCAEGANFGDPTCSAGTAASIGNQCNTGPFPDVGAQCYETGSSADNSCKTGRFA